MNFRFPLKNPDAKFSEAFDVRWQDAGVVPTRLLLQSTNLNAFAEGWVPSVKKAPALLDFQSP